MPLGVNWIWFAVCDLKTCRSFRDFGLSITWVVISEMQLYCFLNLDLSSGMDFSLPELLFLKLLSVIIDFTPYSLMQEPFKSLPLIWTIHEKTLAIRFRKYLSNRQLELVNDWKRVFNRATVVVFPDYVLPVIIIRWCFVV